jgi:hypothetical protein
MLIDCETCTVRDIACGECVVGVLLGPTDGGMLDNAERSAIAVLADSGLVPPLRLVRGAKRRVDDDISDVTQPPMRRTASA